LTPSTNLRGIRAAQTDDEALHGFPGAVLRDRAVTGEAAGAHVCDVCDAHHRAALRTDHYGGEIIEGADRSG
jgi:hypothetical protein